MSPESERADLAKLLSSLRLRLDEQIEDEYNLATFVPILSFESLAAPNTQIIYGRNGTGKTHLLKAFHQYCRANYDAKRVLPVYIDLKTFGVSTVGGQLEISQLIQRYYRLFVAKIVDALIDLADETLTEKVLERIFGGEVHDKRKRIREQLISLKEIFDSRRIEQGMTKYARSVESSRASSTGAKAGVSVSVSGFEPKANAEIGLSAEDVGKNKEAVELIYSGLAVLDYDEIRLALESIIDECGARAITVLVDEWSAIELKIQPILAEMIKKTLSVSNKIFIKIVALKYFTRTSASVDPPQVIGFQPGIDIFPLADLDALLSFDIDQQSVKDLLTYVLYRHCIALDPDVGKKTVAEFERFVCDHVFEKPDAYLEIVRASEGNPRDFLSLLAACCSSASQRTTALTQRDAVRLAISHFSNSKEPNIQDDTAGKLYTKLFENVVKNKQKLFLLTAAKATRDGRIQQLWHYRFIHLVAPTYTVITEAGLPAEYSVFSMDYGKLLALKTHKAGEQVLDLMTRTLERFNFSGRGLVTLALSVSLQNAGLKEKLISVAGRSAVGEVETADLDADSLAATCVYDTLL